MIAFIQGRLEEAHTDCVVVGVGGVGFEVCIPLSTRGELPPVGEDVRLYAYMHVKEDGVTLYGFSSLEEKVTFKKLISVSGIGPKVALSILSSISPAGLRKAIATEDLRGLTDIPGVGPKTARRLVLELKDKFEVEGQSGGGLPGVGGWEDRGAEGEAVQALMALGYTYQEARKAVARAVSMGNEAGRDLRTPEALIRDALRIVSEGSLP